MEPTVKTCTNSAESEKFHQENLVESTNVANFADKEESKDSLKITRLQTKPVGDRAGSFE